MFGRQMIREMDSLQKDMEQLFNGLGLHPALSVNRSLVALNVEDKGDAFVLSAQLPGVESKSLDINVLGRNLTLAGEFARAELPDETVWHRQERPAGRFEKNLLLPSEVDVERVEAEYQQGVLRINLPKAASALPKKINVKAA